MPLFPSRRELRRRHWQYFGRPFAVAILTAMGIGLLIGVVWVIAGILHFHPLW